MLLLKVMSLAQSAVKLIS